MKLDTRQDYDNNYRGKLWAKVLLIDSMDYQMVLEKLKESPSSIAEFANIISMDIERSFRSFPRVSPEAQKNILQAIAFSCPLLGYCQGMNYISGLLYAQFQNEEQAFNCFRGLLTTMKLTEFLDQQLSNSLIYFYKIDRLIAIFLPEIHEVFRDLHISSIHYASPWIITVFISTFQNNPPVILKIWDYFIAKGWKAVFKAIIALLKVKQTEIFTSPSDELMATLNIVSEDQKKEFSAGLIENLDSIPVTNKLLRELEYEYYDLIRMAETNLK